MALFVHLLRAAEAKREGVQQRRVPVLGRAAARCASVEACSSEVCQCWGVQQRGVRALGRAAG